MWTGNFDDKYSGSIFQLNSTADAQETVANLKTLDELAEAVKKHGEVVMPTTYEDEWEERVVAEKKKIAANQGI